MKHPPRWLWVSLLLLILLTAAWLRFWRLAELPPGFYYDEAYNAMDGIWMRDTLTPKAHFVGNTGRHSMMPYVIALWTAIFGHSAYAARLAAPMISLLTVALFYRTALLIFVDEPHRRWLALAAAAGLTSSLWHMVMSRTAYEPVLVPFFFLLSAYPFWRGWRSGSLKWFAAGGVALGLAQYTYVLGRLLPLVFGAMLIAWSGLVYLFGLRPAETSVASPSLKRRWLGLGVMALASLAPFIPLGLFILNDPVTFFFRSNDLLIFNRAAQGTASVTAQFLTGLRVFVDTYSNTWRHNLIGWSGFSWVGFIGFWSGLVIALGRIRRPPYLFILVGLFILWLPAPLSANFSALRMAGMLLFYYMIMAVGWVTLLGWLAAWLRRPTLTRLLGPALIALILLVSGGRTAYGYFTIWANEADMYQAYHGPMADLGRHLVAESHTTDFLLPFEMYVNPTMRFMLYDEFKEVAEPPPPGDRPLRLVRRPETTPSAMVWLSRDAAGQGLIYVGRALPPETFNALEPSGDLVHFRNPRTGGTIALLTPYRSIEPLLPRLTNWETLSKVDYEWGHEVRMFGYEVWPRQVSPGQSPILTLYWQSLIGQPHSRTQFIQLIDHRGQPVGQWTDSSLYDEHRWRTGGDIPDQHVLWLNPQAKPGPYLVRTGLFDYATSTNQRIPMYTPEGTPAGDQLELGLFYVTNDRFKPEQPQVPQPARLGEQIELLGYTPVTANEDTLNLWLHWRASEAVPEDYTIFVQLLTDQNELLSSHDAQPLAGNYPTSAWQPGEVVVDQFILPQPDQLPPGGYRLVTGMYNFETGQRLPATNAAGDRLTDDMIVLYEVDRDQAR